MTEQVAHRLALGLDRRLVGAVRCEPGAMRAGDPAFEIGDGGDHRWPGFGRAMIVGPVVAARMEAEVSGSVQSRNAAIAEIRLYRGAADRLRHGEQSPCRFG